MIKKNNYCCMSGCVNCNNYKYIKVKFIHQQRLINLYLLLRRIGIF